MRTCEPWIPHSLYKSGSLVHPKCCSAFISLYKKRQWLGKVEGSGCIPYVSQATSFSSPDSSRSLVGPSEETFQGDSHMWNPCHYGSLHGFIKWLPRIIALSTPNPHSDYHQNFKARPCKFFITRISSIFWDSKLGIALNTLQILSH